MSRYNKWLVTLSVVLNVVLISVLLFSSKEQKEETTPSPSPYTRQEIEKSVQVKRGAKPDDVVALLGQPVAKEMSGDTEEWHYCRTGRLADEYVAITFENSSVVKLTNYSVSQLDLVFRHTNNPSKEVLEMGGIGDCRISVGQGTYNSTHISGPHLAPTKNVKELH